MSTLHLVDIPTGQEEQAAWQRLFGIVEGASLLVGQVIEDAPILDNDMETAVEEAMGSLERLSDKLAVLAGNRD